MAQIDLRNAEFDIVGGNTESGTVNNTAGYPAGATFVAIDGFTVGIPAGATFLIGSETGTPAHTVLSSVGGSTPIGLTFSTVIASGGVLDNATVTVTISSGSVDGAAIATATTIGIQGFTTAIPAGATFTVAGETGSPTHTVVSTVGGTTPTSVTFTGAIATGGVADDAVITLVLPAGAINHPATPLTNGTTTFAVTGLTGALSEGMILKIVGSTDSYKVVSAVGGSTPTSITVTPAMRTAAGLPANGAAITIYTNVLNIDIGEGNFTFEEKRDVEYTRSKRQIKFVRLGDDQPMEVSFDFIWEFLSSAAGDATPTVEEAIKGTGAASSWKTSGSDPCEPYCVDLRISNFPPCEGVLGEIITLPEYRWESHPHDPKAATVSSKGKCKILNAIRQRVAAPA